MTKKAESRDLRKFEVTDAGGSTAVDGNSYRHRKSPWQWVPLPPVLAEVALIDAESCAAPGQVSVSWWLARVAAKEAPQPVVQRPRCTRWKAIDVADFWRRFADAGSTDTTAADAMKLNLAKASAKAQERRSQRSRKD